MRWFQRYLSSSTSLSGSSEMHHDTCKWVFKISEDLEKKVPVKKGWFSPFFTPKTLSTFLAFFEGLCRDRECFPKYVKNSCEDVGLKNWTLYQYTRKIFLVIMCWLKLTKISATQIYTDLWSYVAFGQDIFGLIKVLSIILLLWPLRG